MKKFPSSASTSIACFAPYANFKTLADSFGDRAMSRFAASFGHPWLLVACMLGGTTTSNAHAQNLLAGAAGGAAGMAAGGYLALSLTVAEARAGRYMTSMDEFLGWRSAPVIIGGATGAAVGLFDPDRLGRSVLYGSVGTAAGLGVGLVIGPMIWQGREGRWAGGAIGAGIGMVIGSNYGMFFSKSKQDQSAIPQPSSVPIIFTYRF